MPTEYLKIINAYEDNAIDCDTMASELGKYLESSPDSLPDILAHLDALQKTKPANLPFLQKLQRDLKAQTAPVQQSQRSAGNDETIVMEQATRLAAQSGQQPPTETVIQSTGHVKSQSKEGGTAADEATIVRAPSADSPAPAEATRLQETSQPTRLSPESGGEEKTSAQRLEPGSVIKNRFILDSLLGEGGMGRVFKARDLRKEEAHDRNPYVAIKVLNDSFKDHPQAFIALQREAKKAQTLAHPNIVNVFDFDRDGETVYMTMEYLQGDSLDRILRQHTPRPLDKPQAIKIIQGICLGLSYAHKRNIIHSDLKPGNVFVTKEGEVKIFDFGIARAVHTQETSGEKTLFDAGSLGGLTPAYASCEMFEGQEPDVRDDIYALACIAYELLGGKHPFNKTPAIKAKQNNLAPERLPHLNRRQNRTLSAGLAFDRQTRIASVDRFVLDLTTRFSKKQKISTAVIIVLIISAAMAYEPVTTYLRQQKIDRYVAQFQTGNEATIQETLKKLVKMPADLRDEILTAAKDPLIAYYEKQAFVRIDVSKGLVDFKGAYRSLNVANALFPDSAQISAARKKLEQRELQVNSELSTRFNFHLQQGNLLPEKNSDDLLDVLAMAAKIDPHHPLLTDKRLAVAYAKQAQDAANQWDFDKAQRLLTVGLQVVPDNPNLLALQQTINRQQEQYQARQQQIAGQMDAKTLRREVENLLAKPFDTAKWSGTLQSYMQQLENLLPAGDRWLGDTKREIALFYLKRAENLRRQGKFGPARSDIQTAEKFDAGIEGLQEEKAAIAQGQANTVKQQQIRAQQQRIADLKKQLLREANNNNVQKAEELRATLATLLDKNDSFLKKEAPESIASAYARLANNALQRGDAQTASQMVAAGLQILPQHKQLISIRRKLPAKISDACELKYAGYGERITCYDTLAAGKGPALVVIPGSKNSKPFAIGKYEISIADFNLYCRATNGCPVRNTNGDLPMTNVNISDINKYLQWLSAQTKATYRLPTQSEWTRAAKATAQPTGKGFNCRVTIGDNIVKGNALLNVNSGDKNSWGLHNYLGNAQELVLDGSQNLRAMGGAYQDPLAKCNISFSRKHNGSADALTGFRVLREM